MPLVNLKFSEIKQYINTNLRFTKIIILRDYAQYIIIMSLIILSVIFLYNQNKNKINSLNIDNFLNNIYLKNLK